METMIETVVLALSASKVEAGSRELARRRW